MRWRGNSQRRARYPTPAKDGGQLPKRSTYVPAPAITLALLARLAARDSDSFAAKMLSAMRNQFGGHEIKKHE